MPDKADIVREARSWKQVKWKHQGRSRLGVDCLGLVICVGEKLGLAGAEHDERNYQRYPNGADLLRAFSQHLDRRPLPDAEPGDVIVFRDGVNPCHVAIVGERNGGLTIIHGRADRRAVVEEPLFQGGWADKRVACFAFRGVA